MSRGLLEDRRKFIGAAIVLALIAVIAVLVLMRDYVDKIAYEPPLLGQVLSTVFIGLNYFLVAYIAARAYLKTASSNFVLLGCALLASGADAMFSFWLSANPNFRVTVFNIGFFVSAIFNLASVVVVYRGSEVQDDRPKPRRTTLAISYLGALILSILVVAGAVYGAFPTFFEQGVGATLPRQLVLATSIIFFAIASVAYLALYRESRSKVLYWYGLGLALIAASFVAVFFGYYVGGPLSWTGRAAQYLSGVYFINSVRLDKKVPSTVSV